MPISLTDLDQIHPTHRYAVEIVNGVRPSCLRERQACERHLKDLDRQGDPDFPFVFDETRADRIFDWFERCCRHVRGPYAGELIELQPFQKFDLGCIFGWVRVGTGQRRFNKAFNMRARGNVKSTEMSGIALYGMCGDCCYPPGQPEFRVFEEMPEIECAAVDKEQAKRVWGDAKSMGEKSPDILKRLSIKRTYVEHKKRGGWMRPLSKDSKNKDGLATCIAIIDEYHAHPTSLIHDVIWSGFGKRKQSLMLIITTAGQDAENSPCKKEYDLCCKILDRQIPNEDYFIMIRELDKDDDPHDQSTWVKANPILQEINDYSRELLKQIKSEHDMAYGSGDPSKIREFLIKRCDRWQAGSENKYMSGLMDRWKDLAVSREEFARLVRGRETFAGLDLSKRIDLTADGFVFPLDDGRFAISAYGFIPEEAARRHELSDRVPYKQWADDGWCKITDGAVTDHDYVKNHINDSAREMNCNVVEVCYDPHDATYMAQVLERDGMVCVEIPQRAVTLSAPTKYFRELVLQGRIVHDGNPLLTWCLSNAVEITDSNANIRLSKKHKDDSQRIDLIAAVLNAFTRAMLQEPEVDLNDHILSDDFSL